MASLPAAPACRNCGTPAGGKFCPECGQDTQPHPPTAREFLHEFVGHYIALEGPLWITLKTLARPGALTLEYLAGRKRRYVHPLRLYLTASIVFFIVAKVFLPALDSRVVSTHGADRSIATFQCDVGDTVCRDIEQRIRKNFGDMTRAQAGERMSQRLVELFPYAMFVLLPVFALLTRAVYWNRPCNYGEHLVFALHYHAAVFFIGALVEPLRMPVLWTLPSAIYLFAAMHKVFGGRAIPSILRSTFVFVFYFILLAVTIAAIVTATALL